MKMRLVPISALVVAGFSLGLINACDSQGGKDGGYPDSGGQDCPVAVVTCGQYDGDGGASDGGGWMCRVPTGCFMMGCNAAIDSYCFGDEAPYHLVELSAFVIDKYEVTMGDFQKCLDAGVCSHHWDDGTCVHFDGTSWTGGALPQQFRGAQNPVTCVDWNQAGNYCQWAGKRLPTEAEWEKAARGTDGRNYPWGSSPQAKCDCNSVVMASDNDGGSGCGTGATMPVGSKPAGASPYGAMDMVGNAWEWVADWYNKDYYGESPLVDPKGPDVGSNIVLRGGSFYDTCLTGALRTSVRESSRPVSSSWGLGFRCAR